MSLLVLLLSLSMQDAPPAKLTYPDVLLADDPLAPLPEGGEEKRDEPLAESEIEPAADEPEVAEVAPVLPDCPTRQFQSEIEIIGPPRRVSPILLCANSNDPADYETMLRSARQQIAFNDDFTFESRARATADIDAELARIEEPDADPDGYVGR